MPYRDLHSLCYRALSERGYRIVGDVEFSKAKDVASLITPVPGARTCARDACMHAVSVWVCMRA